jgi:GAF domain-containing protein
MSRRAKLPKGKAEAKRPLGRKSPKEPGAKVRDLEKRLAEALELKTEALKREAEGLAQQVATSEILRVISQSPTDVQPIFDAIVRHTTRLGGGPMSCVFRLEGGLIHFVAHYSFTPEGLAAYQHAYPRPPAEDRILGPVLVEGKIVNVADVVTELRAPVGQAELGQRSVLAVPMLHNGVPVGAIATSRYETGVFPESQVELLKTFASQAVIAIENVRLFKELEARNRELTESLARQRATANILQVISQAQTDVQPVFEAIADSALRLLGAWGVLVLRYDGGLLRLAVVRGGRPGSDEELRADLRDCPPDSEDVFGRTILTRSLVLMTDSENDPVWGTAYRERGRQRGWRSTMQVPMVSGEDVFGVIGVSRVEPGGFSPAEIALLQTFADQAAIAIENVRLFNETKEGLEQQTATAEILRVIASSPTDIQPVLDTVAESAARLCEAYDTSIFRLDGDRLRRVAHHGTIPAGVIGEFTVPLLRGSFAGRSVLDGRIVHIADGQTEANEFPEGSEFARRLGFRAILIAPLLREGVAIGAITLRRTEAQLFTERQVTLLLTFADQAVIAIENVRLFTELQGRNAEVTEALERQTATGAILRAISQSPTDAQPVFETIVRNGVRVCGASACVVFVVAGDQLHLAATDIDNPGWAAEIHALYPAPIDADLPTTQAIRELRVIHVPDVEHNPEASAATRRVSQAGGYGTVLFVPMLRGNVALGTVAVARVDAAPFSDRQVELLQTFADQAVIAIENVRLFTELQTSNRELTTALDTQTATADILRVISGSRTDVQPVFDAIMQSAVRLLGAYSGGLARVVGDQLVLEAIMSTDPAGDTILRSRFPQPLTTPTPLARAVRERATMNIADTQTDPGETEGMRALARTRGFRSLVVVPLLRQAEAIGGIAVNRREAGGFTEDEIALLKTFADQAVIAIENARLLSELQARTEDLTRSVGELRALSEIGQTIGSTLDLQSVLSTIVARATDLAGADAGAIYEYDVQREVFEPRASERLEGEIVRELVATPIRKGQGVTGRLAEVLAPIQTADISVGERILVRELLVRAGYRALLAVPLAREGLLIGGLTVFRKTPGEYAANVVELLQTFATQSALAIQNARLFRQLEIKSRELEVASQHKSEFLASMSHELRTPLNAIIGFSDVLLQGIGGEMSEKQTEYLQDILASGQHLLSLINDILDLSKIEAGRMELDVGEFHLPSAIDDAMLLMRERAGRRGLTLDRHVAGEVGAIRADQRKVKQVLLNLLSNAVKFTPEGGRVDVGAAIKGKMVEVSVADTGVGIAPEDQEAVFEEFRQVGTADKKVEGTGLGLALSRKFVELHGGRIWVKSKPGAGSTFTFTLPVLRED